MKTDNKKPLYRKVSKTTHNGFEHADYGINKRSRYARHTKKGIKRGMNTQQDSRGHGLYDYTPLFMFLLKQEGRDWNEVWKECMHRLNTTDPVHYMVLNINKNGLVNQNFTIDIPEVNQINFKDRKFKTGTAKAFRYGEGTCFSTMYVDENNKLQFIDKNYVKSPNYEFERRWGETFNGRLYDCYKQSQEKTRKKKSYIRKYKTIKEKLK